MHTLVVTSGLAIRLAKDPLPDYKFGRVFTQCKGRTHQRAANVACRAGNSFPDSVCFQAEKYEV